MKSNLLLLNAKCFPHKVSTWKYFAKIHVYSRTKQTIPPKKRNSNNGQLGWENNNMHIINHKRKMLTRITEN